VSTTEQILNHALALPASDRALLAHQLLESLDADYCDPAWEAAWRVEIERRLADLDSGKETTVDCKEALAEIRTSLQKKSATLR